MGKAYLYNIDLEDPDHPQNHGKVRFEVRYRQLPDGTKSKDVFLNGERFDYSIDLNAYFEACKLGPKFKRAVQADIVKHFTNSISEQLGRRVTVAELEEGQKTGWI